MEDKKNYTSRACGLQPEGVDTHVTEVMPLVSNNYTAPYGSVKFDVFKKIVHEQISNIWSWVEDIHLCGASIDTDTKDLICEYIMNNHMVIYACERRQIDDPEDELRKLKFRVYDLWKELENKHKTEDQINAEFISRPV